MSTHEPTAFTPSGAPDNRSRNSRTALLALGGAGLVAAGLAAGLMLRPAVAPQTLASAPTIASTAPVVQPAPLQSLVAQAPAPQVSPAQTLVAQAPSTATAPPAAAYPAQAPVTAQPPAAYPAQPTPAVVAAQRAVPTHHHRHATTTPAPQPAHRVARHTTTDATHPTTYQPHTSEAAPWREPTRQVATCSNCGIVEGVRPVKTMAQGSGLGAIAGGVVGGLIGNQVGGGNGRKAMTVLGAVGGGFAGNEIEKRTRGETIYEVRVRMEDGSVRTLQQPTAPTPGARVRVDGDSLRSASVRNEEPRYVRTGQTY